MVDENPAWQAIESAPRDETILVYSPRWGPIMAAYSTEFQEWMPRMQCPVSLSGEGDELTHWMPLPAAP